ncbi:MAG: DnaJ C-terminal domain-containing protein [Acidobacteriota bacterium]
MDYYIVLGLRPGASECEIKRAYRRLARRYHPDINPGDHTAEVVFRRIVEAYETLMDPQRRKMYDTGSSSQAENEPRLSFDGFDFSVVSDSRTSATFSELFADVFERSASAATGNDVRPQPGADIHASVALSFEESVRGAEREMSVTRQETCAACDGRGTVRTVEGQCPICHGAGSIRWTRGHMVFSRACTTCGGTGRRRELVCTACAGQGATARTERVVVRIPAGIGDGARLRVPGKGHAGPGGGPPGELVVAVSVSAHPLFQRQGDDLLLKVPIAAHEAMLGSKIDVPTPTGTAKVRVPPGTQPGQRFRLHGRGVPGADGRVGDLVVEVKIVIPQLRDERSKELMREFAQLNTANVRSELGV